MKGRSLNDRFGEKAIAVTLRKECLRSPGGGARMLRNGWSIILTGGPNDALGRLATPPTWRLSGKRTDGKPPSVEQLAWLTLVAAHVARPAGEVTGPEELIVGTWHFTWSEEDETVH